MPQICCETTERVKTVQINEAKCSRVLNAIGTLALAVTLLLALMGCALKSAGQNTPRAVKNALDATVHLIMTDATGEELKIIGSGFFVRPGLIATSLHVIEGVLNCRVKLVGGETTYEVKEVFRSEEHNVALLKVTAPSVKPLSLTTGGFGASPRESYVYALGEPPESGNKFVQYHLGNNSYEIMYTTCMNVPNAHESGGKEVHFQWDELTAQIPPESSGGPVLNSKGEVVGIATQHFSFESSELRTVMGNPRDIAISSDMLQALLDREENSE